MMGNVSVALIVVAILGFSTTFGTGPEERRLMEKCREQYGSHWYHEEYLGCCPCTPCNHQFAQRTVECWNKAEGECEARFHGQCRPYLSISSKTVSTLAGVNVTTVSSTSKSSLQNAGLSMEIVIIVSVVVFCSAVLLACACCLAGRTRVCGLLKKEGLSKLQSHSKSSKSKNYGHESGGSAESKTLIQENADSQNGIQPSFSDSNYTDSVPFQSSNGPPGIMNAQLVRHESQESDYSSEHSRADMADSTAGSRAHRALVRSGMPQDSFSIQDCNGIGVVAAPHSQVIIHHLTVGNNPERGNIGDNVGNHLPRVESRPTAPPTKTFSTSNGINRRDRNLHRQSSEMSSASSGPVENETHPAAVWHHSDARQDQISALETYSQDSCGRASGPAMQNGGASFRRLNSDMSSCSSRSTQSSGLPPECDMEPFGKDGRV